MDISVDNNTYSQNTVPVSNIEINPQSLEDDIKNAVEDAAKKEINKVVSSTIKELGVNLKSTPINVESIVKSLDTPMLTPYVTEPMSSTWSSGMSTIGTSIVNSIDPPSPNITTIKSESELEIPVKINYPNGTWRKFNDKELKSIGNINNALIDDSAITTPKYETAWDNVNKRRQMLNEDAENITNAYGFPKLATPSNKDNLAARYDYQIKMGDSRYPISIKLEDKLRDARVALGIPVHGRNDLAKAMKFYMYNRYKTPDRNMAHNKTFTHIFFTRPDCNLLKSGLSGNLINPQVKNHSEAAMVWRRHPELFRLLTDRNRSYDVDNFNLLLSNQVTSFDIIDENLSTVEAGRSWGQYEMMYGDTYSGRTFGEFGCNFIETNDYSVINLIKLWITYIDNVARGAWMPSYNLYGEGDMTPSSEFEHSHVYTKTLDYASSCYVFKVGPDGEDVLYWSKYYGIFPINTGASALSWEIGNNVGDTPKLNIRFKYSFKRDMSPISLLEFNHNAAYGGGVYEESFDREYAGTVRPYVGTPFIEMSMCDPGLTQFRMTNIGAQRPSIRLKFRPFKHSAITDDMLYRTSMSNRSII